MTEEGYKEATIKIQDKQRVSLSTLLALVKDVVNNNLVSVR